MWATTGLSFRGALQSIIKRVSVASTWTTSALRPISTQALVRSSTPFVTGRLLETRKNDRASKPISVSRYLAQPLNKAKLSGPSHVTSALRPLSSLGGMSFAAYMALEATEGHTQMWKSWNVDVARDLADSLAKVQDVSTKLSQANDRVEDLEIMVNDLTVFVEMQKEEISRLKARLDA